MMTGLLAFFFDTFLGRLAAGALCAVTFLTWFAFDQRGKERRNVVSEINQSAGELARAADQAGNAAAAPGAVERLRKHSCRDC